MIWFTKRTIEASSASSSMSSTCGGRLPASSPRRGPPPSSFHGVGADAVVALDGGVDVLGGGERPARSPCLRCRRRSSSMWMSSGSLTATLSDAVALLHGHQVVVVDQLGRDLLDHFLADLMSPRLARRASGVARRGSAAHPRACTRFIFTSTSPRRSPVLWCSRSATSRASASSLPPATRACPSCVSVLNIIMACSPPLPSWLRAFPGWEWAQDHPTHHRTRTVPTGAWQVERTWLGHIGCQSRD